MSFIIRIPMLSDIVQLYSKRSLSGPSSYAVSLDRFGHSPHTKDIQRPTLVCVAKSLAKSWGRTRTAINWQRIISKGFECPCLSWAELEPVPGKDRNNKRLEYIWISYNYHYYYHRSTGAPVECSDVRPLCIWSSKRRHRNMLFISILAAK